MFRPSLISALACLLVLGTSVSAAAPTGSAPSFARHRSYATATDPISVAIADLNGDGKPDLAIANYGADSVSVLLNRGDGTFEAKRDYRAIFPNSVAIGDLNGDGNPDLATANNEGTRAVSVFLNKGDGTLRPRRDYTGVSAYSIAIGDLNGDGKPDLATANFGSVSVLLNRGAGTFRATRDYAIGDGSMSAASIAVGDLNGDGKRDLVTPNGWDTHSVSVLLNRGDGTFQAKLGYATGAGPVSVAIGDVNGDDKRDLATANFGGGATNTVSALLNRPGLCTVQDVTGKTLQTAKRTLARANCRGGKVTPGYKKGVGRGRVISQRPRFGAVLPGGAKVNLIVSRGRPT